MAVVATPSRLLIGADAAPRNELLIEPPRRWQWVNLKELWAHRELLYFFAWRDIKVRYKQTTLGAAWAVLQPAVLMVIFTLVMGRFGGTSEPAFPYPVFVLSGLIVWTFFATALGGAANSLVASEHLLTKVYFPRLIAPLAPLGPAAIDLAISCALLLLLMMVYGFIPAWTVIAAPLALGVLVMTIIGAGTLLSALFITYRDFRHTMTFLLQAWMFGTPAIYLATFGETAGADVGSVNLASPYTWFVLLNPLNGCVAFFRASVLGQSLPWTLLGASAAVAGVLLVVGLAYFRHVEDTLVDII